MSSDEFNVDDAIRHVCTVLGYSPARACLEIAHRAAEGKLHAFGSRRGPPYVAPIGGGDWLVEEIPAAVWSENISAGWVREGLPWRGGEPYWVDHFVRSEFITLIRLPAVAEDLAPNTPKRRSGGKPKFNYDVFFAEVLLRYHAKGMPPKDSDREYARELLSWCAERFDEESVPDFETLRKKIAVWFRPLRLSIKSGEL